MKEIWAERKISEILNKESKKELSFANKFSESLLSHKALAKDNLKKREFFEGG